jgi:hypothetical protein
MDILLQLLQGLSKMPSIVVVFCLAGAPIAYSCQKAGSCSSGSAVRWQSRDEAKNHADRPRVMRPSPSGCLNLDDVMLSLAQAGGQHRFLRMSSVFEVCGRSDFAQCDLRREFAVNATPSRTRGAIDGSRARTPRPHR